MHDVLDKVIYEYDGNQYEPHALKVNNINPYLVNALDIVLPRRSKPICNVPEIGIGNKPIDGGNYLFDAQQKNDFILKEPKSEKYFYRWIGADELINGYERWCLWLGEANIFHFGILNSTMHNSWIRYTWDVWVTVFAIQKILSINLVKAHQALNKAVDAAYGYKGAATDAARVAFLFERYQQITSLLPAIKAKTKKASKKEQLKAL